MNEINNYSDVVFENIKHIDEFDMEFWYARELMVALQYGKWSNFKKVIDKAKLACELSGNEVFKHFADVGNHLS